MIYFNKERTQLRIVSLLLGLIGYGLCICWFGWRLALVIVIILWSENVAKKARK